MNVTMNNKTVNCGNIGSPGDTARSLGRDFHKQIPSPPYGGGRANVNVNAEEIHRLTSKVLKENNL